MAPEVLGLLDDDDSDDDARPSYTNAVDIWALGVITFQMLTAQLPFEPADFRPLKKYVKGRVSFPQGPLSLNNISAPGCAWIQKCMAPSPLQRPSAGFSRQHQWPMDVGSLSRIAPIERSFDAGSAASASWNARDSGANTASRLLPASSNVQDSGYGTSYRLPSTTKRGPKISENVDPRQGSSTKRGPRQGRPPPPGRLPPPCDGILKSAECSSSTWHR